MSEAKPVPVAVLEGPLLTWSLDPKGKAARRYTTVTLPFGLARQVFKVDKFNPNTGSGEQRDVVTAQVNALKKAMLGGTYTPTSVSAGLRPRHRERMEVDGEKVRIAVYAGDPLPQTDGQQRFVALAAIRQQAAKSGDVASMTAVDQVPITVVVNIDGDTKADFINLQLGRAVDAAHMMSLKVTAKLFPEKDRAAIKLAHDTAKVLATHADSPFCKLVRFGSPGAGQSAVSRLPVTTLASRGTSDLSTSLVGLAKVAGEGADPKRLAFAVTEAFRAVREQAPALLEEDRVLTPPSEGGTRGSATMLVGLGVCLLYRLKAQGRELPEQDDLDKLVRAAKDALSEEVDGNFSARRKRVLMGEFAAECLSDLKGDKHGGIPVGLLKLLSAGAFGCGALPKAKPDADLADDESDEPLEQAASDRKGGAGDELRRPAAGRPGRPRRPAKAEGLNGTRRRGG